MILPKKLTTVTPLSKLLAFVLFILLPFASFFLGSNYQSTILKYKTTQEKQELQERYKKELQEKEEEINLLIENRGKVLKTYKEPYSFQSFGISSPLLQNKEAEVTDYWYKKTIIKQSTVKVDDITVQTWNSTEVIFSGYENFGIRPTTIESLKSYWKSSYTTKNKIKMFWSNLTGIKGEVYGIKLEYEKPFSPNGSAYFVQIIKIINDKLKPIEKVKTDLQTIADSIEYR